METTCDKTVLAVGRVYADVVFTGLGTMPELGREIYADEVTVSPGGGAFITASVLASLGRHACLSTRLPGHPLNLGLVSNLLESGIDISGVERGEPDQPQMTVAIVHDGDRAFLTRRVGPSVPTSFDALMRRPDIAHVHIAELATLADAPGIVAAAKGVGRTVSLDCAWDEGLFARGDLLDLLEGIDLFMPNTAEAEALVGAAELTPENLRPIRQRVGLLAVKRGALGGWAFRGEDAVSVAAACTDVVDTTGAGDSFNAGFIDAWLKGKPPPVCLALGVAAGTTAVTVAGGGAIRPDPARVGEDAARLKVTAPGQLSVFSPRP
jgi:hypothetical protein